MALVGNSIQKRFEEKFSKSEGCWNWMASKDRKGYGTFSFNGATARAPRMSYEIYVGEIPVGMHVLHRCDNRACVNPAHLFIGTNADNMRDRQEKGRTVLPELKGEENANSKLSSDDVLSIRFDSRRQGVIAAQYGITQSVVSRIKNQKVWRHLWH